MKTGIELITEERIDQILMHGYNLDHDLQHKNGEMAMVAATLATLVTNGKTVCVPGYSTYDDPWGLELENAGHYRKIRCLSIAGALIAAEIDRIVSMTNMAILQGKCGHCAGKGCQECDYFGVK